MADFTKDTSIKEIVAEYPECVEIFAQFGLGCIGCAMAAFETLEQGAAAHGIDVETLLKALKEKATNTAD